MPGHTCQTLMGWWTWLLCGQLQQKWATILQRGRERDKQVSCSSNYEQNTTFFSLTLQGQVSEFDSLIWGQHLRKHLLMISQVQNQSCRSVHTLNDCAPWNCSFTWKAGPRNCCWLICLGLGPYAFFFSGLLLIIVGMFEVSRNNILGLPCSWHLGFSGWQAACRSFLSTTFPKI